MAGVITNLLLRRSLKTTPKAVPAASASMLWRDGKKVGKANVELFRHWAAHSEWVRAAIDIRKSQISSAEWDIVPYDLNRPAPVRQKERLRRLFDKPNPRNDSFRTFIEQIIEDILVLDAGVIEVERSLRQEAVALWPVDGGTIKVNALWDGEPEEDRYFWWPDHQERGSFKNRDIVYMMANGRTHSPVGLSPLETLKQTVDAELSGHEYNARQVGSAAPDGIFDLGEGVRQDQVDSFKSYWLNEVAGRGAMAFWGGTKNSKFIPFRSSNRDMQFLEWQIYLVRKIAAVYGLSPQDLGLTHDVNRATSEVMDQQTEDRGVRPLMSLVQDYLTREVVWDEGFGGRDNNLAFRFTKLNLRETLNRAKIAQIELAGVPHRSVNELRKEKGLEPWSAEFDDPMMVTPTGAVRLTDVPTAREVYEAKAPSPQGEPARATAKTGSKG